MREQWNRAVPPVALDIRDAAALLAPAVPGQAVARVTPIGGGMQNSNFRVDLEGRASPVLLRLYQHGRARADKEAALVAAYAPRIRAPRILWRAPANPLTGHPYAVVEWVDGVRLDRALAAAGTAAHTALGRAVGAALAGVHTIAFPQAGFLAGDLSIERPMIVDRDGLTGFLRASLVDGRGATRVAPELTAALLDLVTREGGRLDAWSGAASLVHADFGMSNILVRGSGTQWDVVGIVDWEFAFSRTPAFDFGNLLRPPLDDDEDFLPLASPKLTAPLAACCRRTGGASRSSPTCSTGRSSWRATTSTAA